MPKKHSNKTMYAVIAMLFLGGVGFLVFMGLGSGSSYFLDVSQARAMDADKLRSVRLFGTVCATGITRPERGLGVSFTLEDQFDKSVTVPVHYKGVVPDTFKEGTEVIVEGDWHDNAAFEARVLMTKCPSKYQKENREKL